MNSAKILSEVEELKHYVMNEIIKEKEVKIMKNPIVIVLLLLVVGAGAFFGGIKYQQSQQANSFGQFSRGQRLNRGNGQLPAGMGQRAGQVIGEIISQDDKSLTVKMADNSSKIVLLLKTTTVSKAAEGKVTDLKVGEKVRVFGTNNTDGSVIAQNIQLNPVSQNINSGGSPK
jgi:hypothetical protein